MITRYPTYYKDFKCIASECKTSCCAAGWEILIDPDTAKYYKSVKGDFGKELKKKIEYKNPAHFKLEKNGRCPFLNEKNLCDIYTNLGENHLCQICTEHPRFYECFNDFIECGLGIYCVVFFLIILTQKGPFCTYEVTSNEEINDNYNEDVFNYMCKCRAQIFDYLATDTKTPLNEKMANLLWFVHTIQQNIDSNLLDAETIFQVTAEHKTQITNYLEYLLKLEPNDKNWFDYVKNCIATYEANASSRLADFEVANPVLEQYLTNLANYYVYRYFLRGIYDEDALSRFKFIAVNIAVIKALLFCKWLNKGKLELRDYIFTIKKYAEEIECSDDNLLNIHIACYELDLFSTENILGLFKK